MRNAVRLMFLSVISLMALSVKFTNLTSGNSAHQLMSKSYDYAYGSAPFGKLIDDSYAWGKLRNSASFYNWLDTQYRKSTSARHDSIKQLLNRERIKLNHLKNPEKKSAAELQLAGKLHRLIKTLIPRFSLERGFEFHNVVRYGERQCLLQSVLIAGLLQSAGVRAGVVMVYKNENGGESNNGHAVTLVKLANGKDVLVDASEPQSFAHHQGLFAKQGDYLYVQPSYVKKGDAIAAYESAGTHRRLSNAQVSALDYDFIRSQFYYYRGERAVAGKALEKRAGKSLLKSQQALEESVRLCPSNPLAVYMLGRTYLVNHNETLAASTLSRAYALYARFGWIPEGAREYVAKVHSVGASHAKS